ncbi:hypothetical protein [Micromonospora sp. NPDC049679]|uniref:hypothetical protein n=1 Tax=Micromonospora sp. NPDC049679 TaxID=3155920 RepID=UPI0033FC7FFE
MNRGEDSIVRIVVAASRTNADITLRRPLVVPLQGQWPVRALRLFADDSRDLVSRVCEHLTTSEECKR